MGVGAVEKADGPGAIVVVGAGPGVGMAVAERFAAAEYAVGLIARNLGRLKAAAADLRGRTGVNVAVARADVSVPDEVREAVRAVGADLGALSALCFSPIPDVSLIKPVLQTRPEDFLASLQLNVAGAAAAVESVLPELRARGEGSLLFTTGSAALNPDADRAASAVTTTAAAAYISLLRAALQGTGIRVGYTVIQGPIDRDRADAHHPDSVAADLWAQHCGRDLPFPAVLRPGQRSEA